MQPILFLFLFQTANFALSSVCNREFEETICENFAFSPELTLDSATNRVTIRNAEGAIIHETLSNLSQVKEIKITESAITEIEPGALCSPPNLTSIALVRNRRVPRITRKTLKDCQHIKKINLDGYDVQVENGAFAESSNLRSLTLNATVLPHVLERATFRGLEMLKSLTIRHSECSRIRQDAFRGLKNLKFIDLQSNQIESIAAGTFKGLPQLRVLNLSENKLGNLTWGEFEGLKALKVLFLEHNDFRFVDVDKLVAGAPNLERVFFSYDKLSPESRKKIEETLPKLNITFIYIGKPFN